MMRLQTVALFLLLPSLVLGDDGICPVPDANSPTGKRLYSFPSLRLPCPAPNASLVVAVPFRLSSRGTDRSATGISVAVSHQGDDPAAGIDLEKIYDCDAPSSTFDSNFGKVSNGFCGGTSLNSPGKVCWETMVNGDAMKNYTFLFRVTNNGGCEGDILVEALVMDYDLDQIQIPSACMKPMNQVCQNDGHNTDSNNVPSASPVASAPKGTSSCAISDLQQGICTVDDYCNYLEAQLNTFGAGTVECTGVPGNFTITTVVQELCYTSFTDGAQGKPFDSAVFDPENHYCYQEIGSQMIVDYILVSESRGLQFTRPFQGQLMGTSRMQECSEWWGTQIGDKTYCEVEEECPLMLVGETECSICTTCDDGSLVSDCGWIDPLLAGSCSDEGGSEIFVLYQYFAKLSQEDTESNQESPDHGDMDSTPKETPEPVATSSPVAPAMTPEPLENEDPDDSAVESPSEPLIDTVDPSVESPDQNNSPPGRWIAIVSAILFFVFGISYLCLREKKSEGPVNLSAPSRPMEII